MPARGASANPGIQIYASVVSTLLALLDGISDRGDVIIIGATNRHDTLAYLSSKFCHPPAVIIFTLPNPNNLVCVAGTCAHFSGHCHVTLLAGLRACTGSGRLLGEASCELTL